MIIYLISALLISAVIAGGCFFQSVARMLSLSGFDMNRFKKMAKTYLVTWMILSVAIFFVLYCKIIDYLW